MSESMFDRWRLDGHLALVTGASSGLGQHFARVLAGAGARVVLAGRRAEKLNSVAQQLQSSGAEACALSMDVTLAESVKAGFDDMASRWGVPDIIINNAGVTVTRGLLDQTEEDWDQVMGTNLKGAWLVATEAGRRLVAAKRTGTIVNIASILGERVAGGVAPYAISKAGIIQATKAMALELARHGIRVNALLPGYVVTDLNREFLANETGEKLRMRVPSRRFVQLQDLDGPLLLLASSAGAAMSGACVAVDAGHLVSSL